MLATKELIHMNPFWGWTHKHMHILFGKVISRDQIHASRLLACTWFKNSIKNMSLLFHLDPPAEVDGIDMRDYPKINKDKPAFTIIINNKRFGKQHERKGADLDKSSILSLEEKFQGAIVFHEYILEDLTANEMEGVFKMLAKHDPTTLKDEEIGGALKLSFTPDDCASYAKLDVGIKRNILRQNKDCKVDFNDYSCFMAFIMSHGDENGIFGIDGNSVRVNTLASCIAPDKCEGLKDKPKIFFVQACRGDVVVTDLNKALTNEASTDSMLHSFISGYLLYCIVC